LFHNTWSGQPIRRGDVVMLEVPGVVARYLSPVARSATLGSPPAHIRDRYAVAVESLDEGIAALRPGITCAEAYEAFARSYRASGYGLPIKVGYSVGLTFPPTWVDCEDLNLLPGNGTVLESGMVLHTPRSVRVNGDQTPIVSETTLITETGHRVLTNASRSF
jgi:Xaa-Pro aminopeptidase